MFWLSAIAICTSTSGVFGRKRALLAGLFLGLAFAVSLKSVLLLGSAVASLVMIKLVGGRIGGNALVKSTLLGAIAALLPSILLYIYLAHEGALRAAFYCLVTHNVDGDMGHWHSTEARWLYFFAGWPTCFLILSLCRRSISEDRTVALRTWVIASVALYMMAVYGLWPLVTHQDLLPAIPLVAVCLASITESPRTGTGQRLARLALSSVIIIMCAITVASSLVVPSDAGAQEERILQRVLQLTSPEDYVLDAKGFSIFRKRPIYWALEDITEARMRSGSITDNITVQLASMPTPIVLDDRLPFSDRAFVEENYVAAGDGIYIAGKRIHMSGTAPISFEIAIPLSYCIVDHNDEHLGRIDGKEVGKSIFLGRGSHIFQPEGRTGDLLILWVSAKRRGLCGVPLLLDQLSMPELG